MKSPFIARIVNFRLLSSLFLGAAIAAPSYATTITYADFSSVAGLQINGNAHQQGNVLRLTNATTSQSGSAFSQSAVSLGANASFSSFFVFQISNSGGIGDGDGVGADGLTFTVQTVSNTSGGSGGGIGYQGISNSVAIEFDTYNNGSGDGNNGNHVGVDLSGSVN